MAMAEERSGERPSNQVFKDAAARAAAAGIDPHIPVVSAAEQVKADFGLDIPNEVLPLPSQGKVYASTHPLHLQEEVSISPMTAREEDILTSQALIKQGTVITELIKSCLVDKRIDPRTLLAGDRNALMVAIRITGYGPYYEAKISCESCNEAYDQRFNLAEFAIRKLDIEPMSTGENLFEVRLPQTKKTVRFKFLTGLDEEELGKTAAKKKKLGLTGGKDDQVTANMVHSIVSIDNIDDRSKIAQFIARMPAMDSMTFRRYVRDHEPGVIMRQESTCVHCGAVEEVGMPMGVKFLWPTAER
jgi:hypothetical protein